MRNMRSMILRLALPLVRNENKAEPNRLRLTNAGLFSTACCGWFCDSGPRRPLRFHAWQMQGPIALTKLSQRLISSALRAESGIRYESVNGCSDEIFSVFSNAVRRAAVCPIGIVKKAVDRARTAQPKSSALVNHQSVGNVVSLSEPAARHSLAGGSSGGFGRHAGASIGWTWAVRLPTPLKNPGGVRFAPASGWRYCCSSVSTIERSPMLVVSNTR